MPEPPTTCATCGGDLVLRSDDREDVVRERLAVYQRQTRPLVEFYQTRRSFGSVDGNQTPDVVEAGCRHGGRRGDGCARATPGAGRRVR